MVSFIIPAHNEEDLIASTVRAIRSSAATVDPSFEIIVVDDTSTDRTAEIAAAEGARVVSANVRHIAAARNAGGAAAKGDIFVFVDADTMVMPEVVRGVVTAIRAGAVGGGATMTFDEGTPAYAAWPISAMNWSCRVFRWAPGAFMFCRRDAFEATGGFDLRFFAAEEVYFSRALRKRGRFVVLRETVVTSGRKLRTHSVWEVLWTFVRIGAAGPWALGSRRRLELWYGVRRKDRTR